MSQGREKLLLGIKRGNQEDYRSFYDLYYKTFCQFANRFVEDYETARDIVQDAFINAWKTREKFSELNHLNSFLYKTIHNRCLNHIRDISVAAKNRDEIEYLSTGTYFQNVLIEEEIYSCICQKIEELPEMQKKVIELHIEGMSNDEIAKKLNVSVNTIRTHKQRAKSKLKSELSDLLGVLFVVFIP